MKWTVSLALFFIIHSKSLICSFSRKRHCRHLELIHCTTFFRQIDFCKGKHLQKWNLWTMENSCLPNTRLDEKCSFFDPCAAQSITNWFACGVKPLNAIFAEYRSICFITFQKHSIINLCETLLLVSGFLLLIKAGLNFAAWNLFLINFSAEMKKKIVENIPIHNLLFKWHFKFLAKRKRTNKS